MNPTKHTRWSCSLVRLGASLGQEGDPPFWVRRHVDGCPSCQRHYEAAASLEHDLRRSAPARSAAPRVSLEQDIMREIMGAGSPRERVRAKSRGKPASTHRRIWPTFAVAASAACAVALVFIQRPRHAPPPSGPAPRVETVTRASAEAPAATWGQLASPVRSLLAEDPLQSEARQVYAEARSAVDFLALNFLPDSPSPETDPSL